MVYYTLTPRSGPNKTACAAVLHGSMFSKPCAPAQGRAPYTRAAAQAAALGLLYPDAAQRPQQNRTCCGFAWFNVLKALCASTGACALHMRSRASGGLEVIIPHPPAGFIRSFSNHLTNFVSTCYNKVMATAGCRNGTPSWWPRARTFVRMKSEGGPVPASLFLRRTQL